MALKYMPGSEFNYASKQNMLCVGTTRSGKTTAMLHMIEAAIIRGDPVFIISGKNGANDKYSMYRQVRALCRKHDRKLYAFSTHRNVENKFRYNPFKYTEINGISNAMTVMAQYSDTHYEANFEFWIICICELLEKAGKHKSLPNIMRLFTWDQFLELLDELHDDELVTDEEYQDYLSFEEIASIASASRARFLRYLKGAGERIFIDDNGEKIISVTDVRQKGGVFLMDLDGLMYKDFSYALGTMVVSDLRTMISNERDVESRKLIVFDELSVFFSELLPDIYSQAAGFGYQTIAGSQSFSDMDRISPDLAERIIENSHLFGFLLQNSDSDANRAAAICGTKLDVETTWRSDGASLDSVGSNKIIDRYKVHPNTLKELEPLEMIFYDKTAKNKIVKYIRWDFLDLSISKSSSGEKSLPSTEPVGLDRPSLLGATPKPPKKNDS